MAGLIRLWALGLLVALAVAARPASAEVEISDEARAHFKRGVSLLQAAEGPRYEEAYAAFQAAYAASPSPKILGNLGLCALQLERDGEAIEAYERYLAEAGAVNETEHRQIIDDLVKLKGRVSPLRLTVKPLSAVVVDERLREDGPAVVNRYLLDNGRLRTGIRAGRHRMTIEAEGFEPVVWEFDARHGIARENSVSLKPIGGEKDAAGGAAPSEPSPAEETGGVGSGFMVAALVAGAFTAAAIVTGSLALANKSSFDDALAAGDDAEARDLRDTGVMLNVTTDIMIGGALVSAGVATVLLLTGGDDAGEEEAASFHMAPLVLDDGAGIGVGGAF